MTHNRFFSSISILIWLFETRSVVCSSYGPWITNAASSVPIQFNPAKLVYEQRENVTLECYPPDGARVQWANVNISEGNYAFPSTHVKYIKNEDTFPIQLTILYNKYQWVSQVNVSCFSIASGVKSNFSSKIIEQKYPTYNVVINDGREKVEAKPDQLVTLECKADGNPNSSYGFWYNKTEKAIYRMPDTGRKVSFKFLDGTKFKYACEGRNFFRGRPQWINSSWVEVVNSGLALRSSFLLVLTSILCLALQSPP